MSIERHEWPCPKCGGTNVNIGINRMAEKQLSLRCVRCQHTWEEYALDQEARTRRRR